MKIKHLKIDGYKNLQNIKLEHNSDFISLIGNNGSGKSNLLEAISIIFRNLYTLQKDIDFAFYLEYETTQKDIIQIEKKDKIKNTNISFLINGKSDINIRPYLPKKVIAIYSGEEKRLWKKCYQPFFDEYISNVNKSHNEGINLTSYLPPMLYINKYFWDVCLLCLALSDLEDNQNFLKETLNIEKINSITFEFDPNIKNYKDNLTLEFINIIKNKSHYTFEEFKQLVKQEETKNNNIYYFSDDIFKYLYTAQITGVVKTTTLNFNENLTIENLSEGEKKLLLIKASLEFAAQEDSLFLLDEPDAHIHVNNKSKIIDSFKNYKDNRQIIITTHSPTITQCIEDKSLFMMNEGKFIPKDQQGIIHHLTAEFWGPYQQTNFLGSNKDIILLVEGKHDKVHIQNAYSKLKDEYPSLSFDIFSINSESKIKPLMVGLYEAGTFINKKYIAIYDNDKAGQEAINKGGFDKEEQNLGYRKLTKNKVEHHNFFALLLPKPEGFTSNCTIENMFDSEKYKEAYAKALQDNSNYFLNQSIEDIHNEIKEKSKSNLAESSKDFSKDDFKNFRALFDLILTIKNSQSTDNKVAENSKSYNVEENTEHVLYHIAKNTFGVTATAKYINNKEMLVLKDSQARKDCVASAITTMQIRNKLIEDQVLELRNDKYIFTQDYKFTSPSTAAKVILGRSINGWEKWVNEKGELLDKLRITN